MGIATELINIDVKITPFKGKSNTKAVKAARKTANVKGESLSPETANVIRKRNLKVNAEKAAANKAISETIGTATGTTAAKILEVFEDENID